MIETAYKAETGSAPAVREERDTAPAASGGGDFFGRDGFTFLDFIDIINPLQHIPLVSSLYRQMTGDTIDPGARLMGDTLFGGPIGAAASVLNLALEDATGRDLGGHVLALFGGEESVDVAVADGKAPALDTAESHVEVLRWAEQEARFQAEAKLEQEGGPQPKDMPPGAVPATVVAGATAREGGWFTEAMLTSLAKYQQAAQLTVPPVGAEVSVEQ